MSSNLKQAEKLVPARNLQLEREQRTSELKRKLSQVHNNVHLFNQTAKVQPVSILKQNSGRTALTDWNGNNQKGKYTCIKLGELQESKRKLQLYRGKQESAKRQFS